MAAEILTEITGTATAAIGQRIAGGCRAARADDALAEVGRVILQITVERVSSADDITQSA